MWKTSRTLFGPTNIWICSFREDKFSANQNQEMPWQQEQDKRRDFCREPQKNVLQEKFEDTKGVRRSHKSMIERQYNGEKDKEGSTKHYIEN